MRCVRYVRALCVAGAMLANGAAAIAQTSAIDSSALDASALDLSAIGPPLVDGLNGGGKPEQFLLFGGFDLWRFSMAGYGGLQWAANGHNSDGFIVRLFMAEGVERYRTPANTFSTNILRASVLPGWRFKRGEFELKVFAGLDFENHNLTPDVPGAKLRGAHPGFRVAAETWLEPVPDIMLATSFFITTIGTGFGARGAAGWRVADRFWAGPEISASADDYSRQYKIGAHLTGYKTGEIEWSAAAGYVADSFNRAGLYARIGFLTRQ